MDVLMFSSLCMSFVTTIELYKTEEQQKKWGGKNPGDRGRTSRKTRGENTKKKKPLEKEESPGNKHTKRTTQKDEPE